jgi:hypothetical protein
MAAALPGGGRLGFKRAAGLTGIGAPQGGTAPRAVSDLLDDDVGVVEGGSVGGDVVGVAGEDLGGAVERGCDDDQGIDG